MNTAGKLCFDRRTLSEFLTALAVAAILLGGSALQAQGITGSISGTVLDSTGAAVPNAKLTITNTERNEVVRTVTTDSSGNYSAPQIPVGLYSITVEVAGFKKATIPS